MGITLFFSDSVRLSFPKVCIACSIDNPDQELDWQVFSPPSSSTGKKVWKGANVMFGLATGGIGGAVGGAKFADNTTGKVPPQSSILHSIPVCTKCLSKLTRKDEKRLLKSSKYLFNEEGVKNPLFTIKMTERCAVWTVYNEKFAQAMIETNKGKIFLSLDQCLGLVSPEIKVGEQSDDKPPKIEKIPCTKCGARIIPSTAQRTNGLCMPCSK